MAKFNFKKHILKDLEGEPIYNQKIEGNVLVDDKSKPPRTIADVIASNLVAEDQKSTPEERFSNFILASKVKTSDEVDYSIEELAAIKKKTGDNPYPVVVGRVWEVLEPKK